MLYQSNEGSRHSQDGVSVHGTLSGNANPRTREHFPSVLGLSVNTLPTPTISIRSGASVQNLGGHGDQVNTIAFSLIGKVLAPGLTGKTVRLWDAQKSRQSRKLKAYDSVVNAVAFPPDGEVLALVSSDKTVGF